MRLVDADALKEDCRMANDYKDCKTNVRDCKYDYVYTKMDFCGWLDDAPTVDAVPVVRCKDCTEYQQNFHWCRLHDGEMQPTDYCSYGERKDGEQT